MIICILILQVLSTWNFTELIFNETQQISRGLSPLYTFPSLQMSEFGGLPISLISTAMNLRASHQVKNFQDNHDRPSRRECCSCIQTLCYCCDCSDHHLQCAKSGTKAGWGTLNMLGFSLSPSHIAQTGVALAGPLLVIYYKHKHPEGTSNCRINPGLWKRIIVNTVCIIYNAMTKANLIVDDWTLPTFLESCDGFKIGFFLSWVFFCGVGSYGVYSCSDWKYIIFPALLFCYGWFSVTGIVFWFLALVIKRAITHGAAVLWWLFTTFVIGISIPGFVVAVTVGELSPQCLQIIITGLGLFTISHTIFCYAMLDHYAQLHTTEDYIAYWFPTALTCLSVFEIARYDFNNPSELPKMFWVPENIGLWASTTLGLTVPPGWFGNDRGHTRPTSNEIILTTLPSAQPNGRSRYVQHRY